MMIGQPGSSKTLSVTIVSANALGVESKSEDSFFERNGLSFLSIISAAIEAPAAKSMLCSGAPSIGKRAPTATAPALSSWMVRAASQTH
jgi:hypothetical protein